MSNSARKLSICVALLALPSVSFSQLIHDQKLVHVIYESPSDVLYNPLYESVLQESITNLQSWFSLQLGGKSFSLAPDPVTWLQLPQVTSYYQQAPGGQYDSMRYWDSIVDANTSLINLSFYDPDDVYLLYVDADPLPNQLFGGVAGVALLAANDLRGLSGLQLKPINEGDEYIWANYPSGPNRWIGGLGHELGHALGLGHPGDAYGDTIMQFGYLYYPDTTIADYQKNELYLSPFITSDYSVAVPEPSFTGFLATGMAACLALARKSSFFRRRSS